MFIENLIGSKAKVKLLRILSEVRTAYSLKDLSKEAGLSLSITHKSAEELSDEGILKKLKGEKKQRIYKFDANSPFAQSIFEIFRIEKTRQRKDVVFLSIWSSLEQIVAKTKDDAYMIMLFGSHARGEATINSDLDILIVTDTPAKKILSNIGKIGLKDKLNPQILDLDTFKQHIKNRTPIYLNLKKDGIILFIDKSMKKEIPDFFEEIPSNNQIR